MRNHKRWRVLVTLSGVLALAGCISSGQNSTVESNGLAGAIFPGVTGINLEGEEISVPEELNGDWNLVAVAFERNQQQFVDTWIASADELISESPGFRFYELPTIFEANPIFRLWVNNGMRAGIRDDIARERTITVYVDRDRFTQALAIDTMNEIHVFLLDDAGRIQWRTKGSADAAKLAQLRDVLSAGA